MPHRPSGKGRLGQGGALGSGLNMQQSLEVD